MKRFAVVIIGVVLSGCAAAEQQVPQAEDATSSTAAIAPTTARPSTGPAPNSTATTTPPADVPAGWVRCTDPERGFSIGHPADWQVATLDPAPPNVPPPDYRIGCSLIDPKPVRVKPYSDGFYTALMAMGAGASYAQTTGADSSDPSGSTQETTVNGHRALRVERSGPRDLPTGTRRYGYTIDKDGEGFIVFTIAVPPISASDYAARKALVDTAVSTLRFLPR